MKRAFNSRESTRKLLNSDPKTILQLMDEFSSQEDSGFEFEGYITDDNEVNSIHDAPTPVFFQNEVLKCDVSSTLHQSESSLVLLSQDHHYSRLHMTNKHLQFMHTPALMPLYS